MREGSVLYNGYKVGDRLLEDVMFEVFISGENGEYSVDKVVPQQNAETLSYLADIRWEPFAEKIGKRVESHIASSKEFFDGDGEALEKDIEEFAKEYGCEWVEYFGEE